MFDLKFYKERVIPIAHALLWLSGIWFALWGITLFNLEKWSGAEKNTFTLASVYIIFLLEVALSYLDIGYSETNKDFNAKGYKAFGWFIINMVVTFICGVCYTQTDNVSFLIIMAIMSSLQKYRSVFMAKNTEVYYAHKDKDKTFTSNMNH